MTTQLFERAMQFLSGIVQAIFSRWFIIYLFTIATLFSSVETMIHNSIAVGIGALAATYLTFFAACTFVGCVLARKERKFAVIDLIGIGTIALLFIFGGFEIAHWSRFRMNVAGHGTVDGFNWLVVALVLALFVTRKDDAL